MKYCSNCGTPLSDNNKFCTKCGQAATPSISNNEEPKHSIRLCPDGKYRWTYESSMWKDPTRFLFFLKVFNGIGISMWFIISIIRLCNGMDWEDFGDMLPILLYMMIGMSVLVIITYLIISIINAGKYVMLFEMDEQGVKSTTAGAKRKSAQQNTWLDKWKEQWIASLLDVSLPQYGIDGPGSCGEIMTSTFADIRHLKVNRRYSHVQIGRLFSINRIYARPEDLDFVYEYIRSHSPKA